MMTKPVVSSENFKLVAAKYYDDFGASDLDFEEDLRRFLLIKRLFNQYRKSGELKERLILNHIIIIFNVFNDIAAELLFHELRDYLSELSVFLVLIGKLPPQVGEITTSTIKMDPYIITCLRESTK